MNYINENIVTLRKRKRKSQEQFAWDLNITRARVGGWEEKRNEPTVEMILKMCKYFKVSIKRFITYKFR